MTDSQLVTLDYNEALEWLFGLQRFGSKLGLKYINHLLVLMGNPQKWFNSIHVTGTNGKGSTTAMIASIMKSAGYNVGKFTSPHMSSFTERITVNGQQISFQDVVRIVNVIKPLVELIARDPNLRHPTFFEVVTAMAFKYFAEKRVEFAVIEAGMGGKLDATNVVHSLISVITNVGLEHTEILGDTVLEIAEKKAGIIKEGGVLVTATENDEVFNLFKEVCKIVGSNIIRVGKDIEFTKLHSNLEGQKLQLNGVEYKFDELFIPLLGDFQLTNTASAVAAVEALQYHGIKVSKEAIENGLKNVNWPGRLEIMYRHPLLVLDCAKDPEAARAVKDTVPNIFYYERLIAIVSISSDKNISDMIKHLAKVTDLFIITSHNMGERAADPSHLAKEVQKHAKPYEIVNGVKDAIERALKIANEKDMVLVIGSVFLIGEAREILLTTDNILSSRTKNMSEVFYYF